jgi:hypothetical protein
MTSWTFAESPACAVVTLDDVLDETSALCEVVHDISGNWQFLDGKPISSRDTKLVRLQRVVELHPEVTQLADLPRAWRAWREPGARSWNRAPLFPSDWNDLMEAAHAYTTTCQQRLQAVFELGSWDQYHYDQETTLFTFSSGGVIGVSADARYVGTLSLSSSTWLWSWANESILDVASEGIDAIRAFGEQNQIARLTDAKWSGDETDAWEMTSVTCFLLSAEGVYRTPSENVHGFLILEDVRRAGSEDDVEA